MNLSERIRAVLAIDPAADAVEFEGHWHRFIERGAVDDPVPSLKEFALNHENPEHVFGEELGSAVRKYWEAR